MWHLGVDPGRSGAAVALAPDNYAEVLWSWRTQDDGSILLRIAQVTAEGIVVRKVRLRSPHALGETLVAGLLAVAGADPVLVASESVHVGKNAGTAVGQAFWLGQVLGPVAHALGVQPRWVRPTEWRKAVGVNPRLRGAEVKQDAVRVLSATCDGLQALVAALNRRSVLAHDFEAGGVAKWLAGSSN